MRHFPKSLALVALAGSLALGCQSPTEAESQNSRAIAGPTRTVSLSESTEAFKNPMMGFRPSRYISDTAFKDYEYTSTYKQYIPYNALESSSSDTVQKIIDWSNATWASLPAKNLKVIPRVVLLYPGLGEYWGDIPHDGTPNQWATDALKSRLVAFVAKLGQAWDQDPRVAAIEVGLWGKWGEHNIYPDKINGSDRIPVAFQTALGDAFLAAFPHKKVMVRYPETFLNYSFGFLWDSFALPDDDNAMGGAGIEARDTWRTQMQSGEVAYDWGDQSKLGGSPNGTLGSTTNTDSVIGYIQRMHTSSLGWIAEYDATNPAVAAGATKMQKAFGYRYVLQSATHNTTSASGGSFGVSFTVKNTGVAPMYYNWPIEVSLLNASRTPVWKGTFAGTDLRTWMPGETKTVEGNFTLPSLASGTYTVALAILDPAGNVPALRFANSNYYAGGRTPVGKVGIGGAASDQSLGTFDSLKTDNSLYYVVGGSNPPPVDPPVPPSGDLALNKTVTVSSTESANGGVNTAGKAVDGNGTTRWASEWNQDPSWIRVDLGASQSVNRLRAVWEWSYATAYQIQVSSDGSSWTTVHTGTNNFAGDNGVTDVTFTAVSARYVRLWMTSRATSYGYSLYSLEVYGNGSTPPPPSHTVNLALNKPVLPSSTESANGGVNVASRAVDGNATTRWASEWNIDPSWLRVDLGSTQSVNRVRAVWEWSYATAYQVQVSTDGSNWTTAYTGTNTFPGDNGVTDVTFSAVSARYVRLWLTSRATSYGYSLYTLEVY